MTNTKPKFKDMPAMLAGAPKDHFNDLARKFRVAGIIVILGSVVAMVTMIWFAPSPDPVAIVGLLGFAGVGLFSLFVCRVLFQAIQKFALEDPAKF